MRVYLFPQQPLSNCNTDDMAQKKCADSWLNCSNCSRIQVFWRLNCVTRGSVESSQNSIGKGKVDSPFVFWNILSLNLRTVTWFSSCLKQQKTTLKKKYIYIFGARKWNLYSLLLGDINFFYISTSSTNAYMLIYRLKDPARNASMLTCSYLILICTNFFCKFCKPR